MLHFEASVSASEGATDYNLSGLVQEDFHEVTTRYSIFVANVFSLSFDLLFFVRCAAQMKVRRPSIRDLTCPPAGEDISLSR